MAGTTTVVQLDAARAKKLRAELTEAGFAAVDPPAYADFAFKGEGVSVVRYSSGKLVVQGKESREFLAKWLGEAAPKRAEFAEALIGADESGKGDYFGPLVVAACALDPEVYRFLDEVPLRDSKTLSAKEISEAAETLKNVLPERHKTFVLWPRKYNELYDRFGNLNRLLAWMHAKTITEVAEKSGVKRVLLDKFCEQVVVERALGEAKRGIDFRMEVRAEANPAVAAASILARDAFVRSLKWLEREHDCKLPPGAGEPTVKALRALVATKGRAILPEVAKLHFKTTESI
jgi:ribonuclease HIII